MKTSALFLLFVFSSLAQDPAPEPAPVLVRGPVVAVLNPDNQDYYGYNGYYYGGTYYGYGGGYAARGRDWNNYSDGRYESRGNHRAADRARGGGGRR